MTKAAHAIPPERIRALAADKYGEEMEESAAGVIASLLDDMLDSIVDWSVKVAESRGSNSLDPEDVQFICEQEWGINLSDSARGVSTK
jgi:histone H3/H4